MTDDDTTTESGSSKAGWFAMGVLAATLVFGLFMFAGDYFRPSNSAEITAETPELIIEGK